MPSAATTSQKHHHRSNSAHRHHSSTSHHHRNKNHRNHSSSGSGGGWWWRWGMCGLSPCVLILVVVLFVLIFGLIIFTVAYGSSGFSSITTTTTTIASVGIAQPQQPPNMPGIDRQSIMLQITALMDYYQRLNVNVSGLNDLSRRCYDRMVRDHRFKQMTTALVEMIRYDVCIADTHEDIIYKAKTWYGYAPKKPGAPDLVEALYCDNCSV